MHRVFSLFDFVNQSPHTISSWRTHSVSDVDATDKITATASDFLKLEFKKKDALHLACAVSANCEIFFTTDDGILKRKHQIADIAILNPVDYITHPND